MRTILTRARWMAVGLLVGSLAVTLWAQEPQVSQRGFTARRGNISAASGIVYSGGGPVRDYRAAASVTADSNSTYTAANILSGWVTRSGITTARTDALPTAANLATAMPGLAVTGASFDVWVQNTGTAAAGQGAMTLNGASTGVTYSTPCSTALATTGVLLVRIAFTSASAYTALCK